MESMCQPGCGPPYGVYVSRKYVTPHMPSVLWYHPRMCSFPVVWHSLGDLCFHCSSFWYSVLTSRVLRGLESMIVRSMCHKKGENPICSPCVAQNVRPPSLMASMCQPKCVTPHSYRVLVSPQNVYPPYGSTAYENSG